MKQELTVKQKKLFEMTQLLDDSGCWIWQGQVSNSGYGRTMIRVADNTVKMVSAQSASYQQFIAEVPDGYLVKQSCGNRFMHYPTTPGVGEGIDSMNKTEKKTVTDSSARLPCRGCNRRCENYDPCDGKP